MRLFASAIRSFRNDQGSAFLEADRSGITESSPGCRATVMLSIQTGFMHHVQSGYYGALEDALTRFGRETGANVVAVNSRSGYTTLDVRAQMSHTSQFRQAAGFDLLKHRILLRLLDEVPSETHCLILREVLTAAAMARVTGFPLLLFPCLFEERVSDALRQEQERLASYWNTLREPEKALSV